MRNIFVKILMTEAEKNPDLYLLTGDLGFRAFEPFKDKFPNQFINVGIAEANMVGIAVGLALAGKRVCIYSIASFVTFRCLEQIRNDICYHNLDIKIIGVGGGFSYGNQGYSHNTVEDLAIMRTLPNMAVVCPGDKVEAELAIGAVLAHNGPAYLRLGLAGERIVYVDKPELPFGKGLLVKKGNTVTLVSIGNIIETVLLVAEFLEREGISARVISIPFLKPFDSDIIIKAAQETKALFTVEEHGVIGGLGGASAEVLLEAGFSDLVFKRFALDDKCHLEVGNQKYLRRQNGLCAYNIVFEILRLLKI